MGLIECPDCGKKISDKAPSCPNCGRPMQEVGEGKQSEQPLFNEDGSVTETGIPKGGKSKSGGSSVHGESEGCFLQTLNAGCIIILALIGLMVLGFIGALL